MRFYFSARSARLKPLIMSESPLTLADIRIAIDEADNIILRGLAARLKAVSYMKALKREQKLEVEDPARESELKKRWKEKAKTLGVSQELALLMLDFILAESKQSQQA